MSVAWLCHPQIVEQGCVIILTILSIDISLILVFTLENPSRVIKINYRTEDIFFCLSKLKTKGKVTTTCIIELQYADDNLVFVQWDISKVYWVSSPEPMKSWTL